MVFQICFDVYESATQHFIDEVMEGLGIKQKKEESSAMEVESSGMSRVKFKFTYNLI